MRSPFTNIIAAEEESPDVLLDRLMEAEEMQDEKQYYKNSNEDTTEMEFDETGEYENNYNAENENLYEEAGDAELEEEDGYKETKEESDEETWEAEFDENFLQEDEAIVENEQLFITGYKQNQKTIFPDLKWKRGISWAVQKEEEAYPDKFEQQVSPGLKFNFKTEDIDEWVSVPVTLEEILSAQKEGNPSIMTRTTIPDIATFKKLIRFSNQKTFYYKYDLGNVLLDPKYKIFRADPKAPQKIQTKFNALLLHPVPPLQDKTVLKFPVVIFIHGNAEAYIFNSTAAPKNTNLKKDGLPVKELSITGATPNEVYFCFYNYQKELAEKGFISLSIDCNPVNIIGEPPKEPLLKFRADMVLEGLRCLERINKNPKHILYNRVDLGNIGLVGHSRGADAVVCAEKMITQSYSSYKIRSVVSISPPDATGSLISQERLTLTGDHLHYLVLHGSNDGDIDGRNALMGSGFRHYDRATCRKAMFFIHGAWHNGFLDDSGRGTKKIKLEDDKKKEWDKYPQIRPNILSRGDQLNMTKDILRDWFCYTLKKDITCRDLFTGQAKIPPSSSGSITYALQWSLGTRLVVESFHDRIFGTNNLSGKSIKPAFAMQRVFPGFDSFGVYNGTAKIKMGRRFPHQTEFLLVFLDKIKTPKGVQYINEIPVKFQDFQNGMLTFRLGKWYDIDKISSQTLPEFKLTLKDSKSKSATINSSQTYISKRPVLPYYRQNEFGENITVTPFQTVSVAVADFKGINAAEVRSIEFNFESPVKAHYYLDDLQLIKF